MGPVVEMFVHVLSKACSSQDPIVGTVDSEIGSSQLGQTLADLCGPVSSAQRCYFTARPTCGLKLLHSPVRHSNDIGESFYQSIFEEPEPSVFGPGVSDPLGNPSTQAVIHIS